MLAYQQCAHNINTNKYNNEALSFYVAPITDGATSDAQFYAFFRHVFDANGASFPSQPQIVDGVDVVVSSPETFDPQNPANSPEVYAYVAHNPYTNRLESCTHVNSTHCMLSRVETRLRLRDSDIVEKLPCRFGCSDTYTWYGRRMRTLCNAAGSGVPNNFNWFNVFCRSSLPEENPSDIRDRPFCVTDTEYLRTFGGDSYTQIQQTWSIQPTQSERRMLLQGRRLKGSEESGTSAETSTYLKKKREDILSSNYCNSNKDSTICKQAMG
jgi:hypothetical protein